MNNTLTLAVAGGRKTQSIVEACCRASAGRSILALTFTQRNQAELARRLAVRRPIAATVKVMGWFSFLLRGWVRPYLPTLFAGRRLRGLNFDGDPGRFATGEVRFLDADGRAYRRHLAQLALLTNQASTGAVLDRISRIYHELWIDEVQDMNGYDLEVMSALMESSVELHMVGDIRQAIISTNVQDPKHKQYKGVMIKKWFDLQAGKKRLAISHAATTWRCSHTIASFADSIFDASWGFEPTRSENHDPGPHCGIFAVATADADAYCTRYLPLCLRYSKASWADLNLPFVNIGEAKGAEADHVLIAPTGPTLSFLRTGKQLAESAACSLYVAVTRARQSVAFLCDKPKRLGLPIWTPP